MRGLSNKRTSWIIERIFRQDKTFDREYVMRVELATSVQIVCRKSYLLNSNSSLLFFFQ